jgi:TPR repeat protein
LSSGDLPQPPGALEALVAVLQTMNRAQLEAVFGGDPVHAAPWVRAAAQVGLPEGQMRYGRMLLEGRGVAQDQAAALAWFARVAETGDADAQNMVGRCHENGWGAPADAALAAQWYRRAAEAGHAWAQYNLGHLCLDGLGVARDPAAAYAWYRQAAEQGHERAMSLVGRCFEEGWGVAADPEAARDWYRRSAEGGYFRGQYNHASLLARDGDIDDALIWFEAACEGAPPESRRNMAQALTHEADPRLRALGEQYLVTSGRSPVTG